MRLKTIQRIQKLTHIDLNNKTVFELLASAFEEGGEFARELKIEEGTPGNTYKKPDEGTKAESVDAIICWFALYFARGGTFSADAYCELDTLLNAKLDKWEQTQKTFDDPGENRTFLE